MKVLVDINHPAHVHFFKYLIGELRRLGHEVIITAINKDITLALLDEYGFEYLTAGRYGKRTLSKVLFIPCNDYALLKIALAQKPDALLGIASYKVAHVGRLFGKKAFIFDDTEHSTGEIALYSPFASAVFTPACFGADIGRKQVRYRGYHELAYLHPNRFVHSPKVLKELGMKEDSTFSLVRFVSWQASHDRGGSGLTDATRCRAIETLSRFGRVFISSERSLPDRLEHYRLTLAPGRIHDLLAYATLVYGESATMCSEASVLGVHSIFCDVTGRGYTDEQERKYGLVSNFRLDPSSQAASVRRITELMETPELRELGQSKRSALLADNIDVTEFALSELLRRIG